MYGFFCWLKCQDLSRMRILRLLAFTNFVLFNWLIADSYVHGNPENVLPMSSSFDRTNPKKLWRWSTMLLFAVKFGLFRDSVRERWERSNAYWNVIQCWFAAASADQSRKVKQAHHLEGMKKALFRCSFKSKLATVKNLRRKVLFKTQTLAFLHILPQRGVLKFFLQKIFVANLVHDFKITADSLCKTNWK